MLKTYSIILTLIITFTLLGCDSSTSDNPETSTPALSQELINTLSHMGNEERLAYDVYNALYITYPSISTLNTIPTKSEIKHIQSVQKLVQKYVSDYTQFTNTQNELEYKNTPVEEMQAGTYDIPAIQELYDLLMEKGVKSERDALEVACMIEVTDISDLNEYIELAQSSNVADIESSFVSLRSGSYTHYWAFDTALVNMGVSDGCCSLGIINGVDYCHNEYPQ